MNQSTPSRQPNDWPALVMALFLAMGATSMLMLSALLAIIGLTSLSNNRTGDPITVLVLAGGVFSLGILLLPGIYFNTRKFIGSPEPILDFPVINDWILIPGLMILWIFTLGLGQFTDGHPLLAALILPIINTLAIGLPILLYIRISLRGLDLPTARRGWSVLGASLAITPTLALVFEAVVIGIIIFFFYLYASTLPGLKDNLALMIDTIKTGNANDDEMTRLVASVLITPGATLTALSMFSVAIPLIEETLKLTVVWFYIGRIQRPVDGFVLGILCGAAFAMSENIGFASAGAADWATSAVARATSALPHIFNSGLLGWGLVSAWKEHRYGRLIASYIAVLLIHGSWNAVSLGLAMNSFIPYLSNVPSVLQYDFAWYAGWGVLATGAFGGLIYNNLQMRKLSKNDMEEKVVYNLRLSSQATGENDEFDKNPV